VSVSGVAFAVGAIGAWLAGIMIALGLVDITCACVVSSCAEFAAQAGACSGRGNGSVSSVGMSALGIVFAVGATAFWLAGTITLGVVDMF